MQIHTGFSFVAITTSLHSQNVETADPDHFLNVVSLNDYQLNGDRLRRAASDQRMRLN